MAPNRFICSGGANVMAVSRTTMPMPTNFRGRSRAVRPDPVSPAGRTSDPEVQLDPVPDGRDGAQQG